MDGKKELRNKMIILRKNILNKETKSERIVNKIMKLDVYQKASVIAIYKSMKNEVNMDLLIKHSLNNGKIVLLPRVVGNDIIFFKYYFDDFLEKSNFNVLEPIFNKKTIYDKEIHLAVVPGLAFDKENNRLGYGKGFYDRFLANKAICKIGVCFKEQLMDNIPTSSNDIKMDLILTD
jgi:5-formyltetrahydrofolate cyclo-ligase